MTLDELFKKKKLSGISGIDTRKLTRLIRNKGVIKGKIVDASADDEKIINELKNTNFPTNQVENVSTKTSYASPGRGFKVVLMDFGSKHGIIRELSQRNCDITVVSQDTSAEECTTHTRNNPKIIRKGAYLRNLFRASNDCLSVWCQNIQTKIRT